ncbi:PAS domain-containing protein [Kitasatospora sp. NPDC048296]|uniref:PAS domain-containing protein n=1 Tax=Kitasatospora sp. NPDC048296 TaxID=3364048 RepID=UPI00371A8415
MNMPLGATCPPDSAAVDGPAGADGPGSAGGTDRARDETGDGADSGTDGRVDGTAQEPSGPHLDNGGTDDRIVGSAEWDLLTDGIQWNAETYLLLGCDPGHGPLSLDRLPDRLPEADRPVLRRMMTDALVHGRPAAGTLRIRRTDGRHNSVECAGEPVLGADGTVTSLRMLLRPAPPA